MSKLVFPGQPISKDNTRARAKNGHYYLPLKYRLFEQEKQFQFMAQKHKFNCELPLSGEIELIMRFYYKDKRFGDLGNAEKSILDALNKMLYHDDKQIAIIHKHRFLDRQNPRIEIDVIEISPLTKEAKNVKI
jgi:Holliday junction resolvase RusA-like endonuclease